MYLLITFYLHAVRCGAHLLCSKRIVPILLPDLLYRDGAFHEGLALEWSQDSGRITRVGRAEPGDDAHRLPGRAVVPGFVNAHSHAFQRAMRGRTQWRRAAGSHEDFWSWRDAMYRVALALDADDVFAVTRQCFVEMLLAGYTAVGEFHYLHRDADGKRYADANELAKRVLMAATDVGIRICLLNVAYVTGGVGEPLRGEQRRFGTPALDELLEDLDAMLGATADDELVTTGVAAHSLRAVPADWLRPLYEFACERDLPFHMHASEQPAEVLACEVAYGRRPIELLAECGVLGSRTTLVHATHVNPHEVALLSGTTVCACPTTERDLGDGFLEAAALLRAGADIALGSDSQTMIDPLEEMRLVEYHERLRSLRRVILAGPDGSGRLEVAPTLLAMATSSGARSLRIQAGSLMPGAFADLVAIDLGHPALAGWTVESLAALLALCAPKDVITDVWVGGVQRVAERRHAAQDEAASRLRHVMRRLG